MPFEFSASPLAEVQIVQPRRFADERGWFAETFKGSDFDGAGIGGPFVQDNESISSAGTVRGLHYQLPPHAQGKLVRVVRGRVWDVAVDVRRSSDTFGKWVGYELSAENGRMLWIPVGFAHGFVALEDDAHLTYKCTDEYAHDAERSILWNDPDLAIEWPTLLAGTEYQLSSKDATASAFADAEVFE